MGFKRCSGILMPLSSLPGGYGIGSMGNQPVSLWIFWLRPVRRSGRFLPVGPTGYADSPYQSCSAFCGQPYFIDLDQLVKDGLLTRRDFTRRSTGAATRPRSTTAPCTRSASPCCARPTPNFP